MATLNIVLGGAAGQGINTTEELLTKALKESGFNIFATKEYMSRVRGGINTTTISISSSPVRSYREKIDILVPFAKGVVDWTNERLFEDTLILGEKYLEQEIPSGLTHIVVEIEKLAKDLGNKLFANTILSGLLFGIVKADKKALDKVVEKKFSSKGEEMTAKNVQAAEKGYELSETICKEYDFSFEIERDSSVCEDIVINGSEAVALGSLNGGCNFVSFYPMSPSTNVAVELANMAEEMGIIVEQFEDEIAASNASIGAWFGGGRGLVTTSGGGFSLMCESLSLAGMSESPVVIHLAQRPGPATGLPTRTAQGDLNLALYAGHGDFPRVMYAPSNIEEAYALSTKAFDAADKFQVPVILLTDEYLVDMYYNVRTLEVNNTVDKHIVEMNSDYKRYKLKESGISPRGVPGYGEGIIIANGNEHDEYGDTTEEIGLTTAMQQKRMKKLECLKDETLEPFFYGNDNCSVLMVSWGSTRGTVKSLVDKYRDKGLAMLHFSQVYPVYDASDYLENADKIIAVEQNITGQFADLIHRELDVKISERILKYDGRQISEEFLEKELSDKGVL
ncbi:MAG: 2-oxoacid:acceptor oxidoreductase subunit alpha [Flexistipes sinusarabici]|uniref:2-oxoacid:acceptor oxidoreductase subunit alpha n=1 Tax=Flexistipes sinusarabici TaxID=2352 RepID=A0A5D0MIB1_FLESI|nr:2-oxoacid:acceptor oxidoreductase subunit alpha [Flexistipes sinusarabici]TYB33454.1 MAG: 2-oxoacid:acceptor oxidoreductase subunit alpha [Flexistipes sinusarabici]